MRSLLESELLRTIEKPSRAKLKEHSKYNSDMIAAVEAGDTTTVVKAGRAFPLHHRRRFSYATVQAGNPPAVGAVRGIPQLVVVAAAGREETDRLGAQADHRRCVTST